MPRKKRIDAIAIPIPGSYSPPPERALKTQRTYGSEPWKPGEIPRYPLRTVIAGPKERAPYGEEMGVRKPIGRGSTVEGTVGSDDEMTGE